MSELRTNKIYPRDGLPAGVSGGIIQIVEKIDSTANTTTSTSWTNSGVDGLNISITPTSASNKILMMVTMHLEMTTSSTGSIIFARNPAGTPVYFANSGVDLSPNNSTGVSKLFLSQGYSGLNGQTTSHFGVDSPGTTSSVTYGLTIGVFMIKLGIIIVGPMDIMEQVV